MAKKKSKRTARKSTKIPASRVRARPVPWDQRPWVHTDAGGGHGEEHSDTPHADAPHEDAPHADGGSHQDSHSDHGDAYLDSAHFDHPHDDWHFDGRHVDSSYRDAPNPHWDRHGDEAHRDAGHTDWHYDEGKAPSGSGALGASYDMDALFARLEDTLARSEERLAGQIEKALSASGARKTRKRR